ncbi:MAG: glutamate--tRNA ligase 2 [Paracoccaceae bacterium]|nr:MAG: glutamate--tRNA ligase 2 [Paracoccaceae bacterium]
MGRAMIVTRFAPSPTGHLHLGNLRAALFSWALARKAGGRFILRLDDTDPERSRPEFADSIRRDLEWLGLTWDEELRQSGRAERHREAAEALKAAGRLYPCFESEAELAARRRARRARGLPPVYDRAALRLSAEARAARAGWTAPHWRFLLPDGQSGWTDAILGAQAIDLAHVSDPVLIRSDGVVLYTLASVVDDADLGITDVIRGADHVTNTAVQIALFRALGAEPPRFAHHGLVTLPGGEALSKRAAALSLGALRAAGVEPLALLSLMARLGSPAPVEPFLSHEEIVRDFDLGRFGAAPVVLEPDAPARLSARLLRALPHGAVAARLAALGIPAEVAPALWAAVRGNIARLEEAADWWAICRDGPGPVDHGADAAFVTQALALLPDPPWHGGSWAEWTAAVGAATGRRGAALYRPLRRALTGRDSGPEMAALMPLMRVRPAPPA